MATMPRGGADEISTPTTFKSMDLMTSVPSIRGQGTMRDEMNKMGGSGRSPGEESSERIFERPFSVILESLVASHEFTTSLGLNTHRREHVDGTESPGSDFVQNCPGWTITPSAFSIPTTLCASRLVFWPGIYGTSTYCWPFRPFLYGDLFRRPINSQPRSSSDARRERRWS